MGNTGRCWPQLRCSVGKTRMVNKQSVSWVVRQQIRKLQGRHTPSSVAGQVMSHANVSKQMFTTRCFFRYCVGIVFVYSSCCQPTGSHRPVKAWGRVLDCGTGWTWLPLVQNKQVSHTGTLQYNIQHTGSSYSTMAAIPVSSTGMALADIHMYLLRVGFYP